MPAGLPKPGTLRFELLAALVRNDHADTEELMQWCDPLPRFRKPVGSARVLEERAHIWHRHRVTAKKRISRELSYMQQRGLVEGIGPAELEPWVLKLFQEAESEEEALRAVLKHVFPTGFVDYDPYDRDPDEVGEQSPPLDAARLTAALVLALVDGPRRRCEVAAVALDGRKETGACQRAWDRLVVRFVIRPTTQRRPTQAGRDYIAEHAPKRGAGCA